MYISLGNLLLDAAALHGLHQRRLHLLLLHASSAAVALEGRVQALELVHHRDLLLQLGLRLGELLLEREAVGIHLAAQALPVAQHGAPAWRYAACLATELKFSVKGHLNLQFRFSNDANRDETGLAVKTHSFWLIQLILPQQQSQWSHIQA